MSFTRPILLSLSFLSMLLLPTRAADAGARGAYRYRAATSAAGSTVGWQEHSKNDLRSWPQLKQPKVALVPTMEDSFFVSDCLAR
jgi:hypothetical protein